MRRVAAVLLMLLAASGAAGKDEPTRIELAAQADAAYEAGQFEESAALYERAVAAEDTPAPGLLYNAACSRARAGEVDAAFDLLTRAVDGGQGSSRQLREDPDLDSLHADARWAPLLARVARLHPEEAHVAALSRQDQPPVLAYFPARRALQAGMDAPPRGKSPFRDYYANAATFLGQYDEARAYYAMPPKFNPAPSGHLRAVPANALVLDRAEGRKAVFLNESHAEVQTRAALYTLLKPLREAGFTHLALETLTAPQPTPTGDKACEAPLLFDTTLLRRRYPVNETGYYTREPVYGELLREALRLGFVPVSYDGGNSGPEREQHQAQMLACVFQRDPRARLVVIAGFGHISEKPDDHWAGGAMAYRFRQLTGIDPLTVDFTGMLSLDPTALKFPPGDRGRGAQAYALLDAKDQPFGGDGYDLKLYVRGPSHRNDRGGSWLELGGAREPSPVPASACKGRFPCVVEARAEGEGADAIPSDRCIVLKASQAGCTLYLRPGGYELSLIDATGKSLGRVWRQVGEGGPASKPTPGIR